MTLRFWGAVGAGLVVASLTDWLFAGVFFHRRYQTYPEVWRFNGANPVALLAAQVLTIPTVFGLVILMEWVRQTAMSGALMLAFAIWVIAAAPSIIVNGLYVKIDRLVVASHAAGWLAKLAMAAVCASLILQR